MTRSFLLLVSVLCCAVAYAEPIAVRELKATELPSVVTAPEGFQKAIAFKDKNGDNYVLFATRSSERDGSRSASLEARHVVVSGGVARVLRTVKEAVEDCEEDVVCAFIDRAVAVTDLDANGFAEVTFAYRVACKGDVSPDTIKLLVLENGNKLILRGEDRVYIEPGHERRGGRFKPDPAPGKWPTAFFEHAKKTWAAIIQK